MTDLRDKLGKALGTLTAILACLALAAPLAVQALVVHKLDSYHPLKVGFSTRGFNRIVIKEGRVKRIIAPEGLLEIHLEETTGQAFVAFTRLVQKPIVLSVITDQGNVQDLEITPSDVTSEVVLLSDPSLQPVDSPHHLAAANNAATGKATDAKLPLTPQERAKEIIADLMQGIAPSGYARRLIPHSDPRKYSSGSLKYKLTDFLEGPFETLAIYRITNEGSRRAILSEALLSRHNDRWIFISDPSLPKHQSTTCIIATRKGEVPAPQLTKQPIQQPTQQGDLGGSK